MEIVDEKTGELVYCVRIKGKEFNPKVFAKGSYKVTVKDTENDAEKVFEGVAPVDKQEEKLIVRF